MLLHRHIIMILLFSSDLYHFLIFIHNTVYTIVLHRATFVTIPYNLFGDAI
jgi:hypothetical protein